MISFERIGPVSMRMISSEIRSMAQKTLGSCPALSALRIGDIHLALSNAFDFASHVSAVAFIEIHEAQHSAIAQSICQPRNEIPGQVRTTVVIKVHRQEGDVVGNVDVAEAIIKLDTIVDRERLRSEMNMLKMQIPVTVSDPVFTHSCAEKLAFRA